MADEADQTNGDAPQPPVPPRATPRLPEAVAALMRRRRQQHPPRPDQPRRTCACNKPRK